MIIVKDLYEYRKYLCVRAPRIPEFYDRIEKYIDINDILGKKFIKSLTIRPLEFNDLSSLQDMVKRFQKTLEEAIILYKEGSGSSAGDDLFWYIKVGISTIYSKIIDYISVAYFFNPVEVRKAAPKEWIHDAIIRSQTDSFTYPITAGEEYGVRWSEKYQFIEKEIGTELRDKICNVLRKNLTVNEKYSKTVVEEPGVDGGLSLDQQHLEFLVAGWYEDIKKELSDEPEIKEYIKTIDSLKLESIDVYLALKFAGINGVHKNMTALRLIEIFWDNEKAIRKKCLGIKVSRTPTHVVNVIWAILTQKEKEDD